MTMAHFVGPILSLATNETFHCKFKSILNLSLTYICQILFIFTYVPFWISTFHSGGVSSVRDAIDKDKDGSN